MHAMSRSGRVRDQNLIYSDAEQAGNRTFRKFRIEFVVKPGPNADVADSAAGGPLVASNIADVFRAPSWMEPAAGAAPSRVSPVVPPAAPPRSSRPPRPRPVELDRAEAVRRVQQLELESVTVGKTSSCVINRQVCRVGQMINGLTVDSIAADAVVVRNGSQRFEVKLKKP
jgi:hypothetical protein